MVFINGLTLLIMALYWNTSTYSQQLYTSKLKTKQAIENIRFIEKNGHFTYFQNKSGELFLAKNFSSQIVLKDIPNTQYNLSSTPDRKKITVTKDDRFYSFLSTYKNLDIFTIDYGTINSQLIGQGLNPQLHLNDEWISFYDIENNVIKFFSFQNTQRVYKIMVSAPELSRHIPQVVMINDNQLVYTDLNKDYQAQLFSYYPQTKQRELLYQSEQRTSSIEICKLKDRLYFSQTSKTDQLYSQILSIYPEESPTLKKINVLYNRSSKDLGHLLCHDHHIFFYKQRENQESHHVPDQDLFSIHIDTKELQQRTRLLSIENLFLLDGRIMSILAGEFYQLTPNKRTKAPRKLKKTQSKESIFERGSL